MPGADGDDDPDPPRGPDPDPASNGESPVVRGVRALTNARLTLGFCLVLCAVFVVERSLWTSGQYRTFYEVFVARQDPSIGWVLAPLAHSPVDGTHLLGNLAQLLLFGTVAEQRTTDGEYFGLIVASGLASIGGQVASYAVEAEPAGVGTLGASGVAFALTALVVVDSIRYQAVTDRWHGEATWAWTLFGLLLSGQAVLEAVVGVPGIGAVGHFVGVLVGGSYAAVRPRAAMLGDGGSGGGGSSGNGDADLEREGEPQRWKRWERWE